MKKDGIGGGHTKTGLIYEGKVELANFLNAQKGYAVIMMNWLRACSRNMDFIDF